jgi:hypothetical protein
MLIASLAGKLRLFQLATAENLELMLIASFADKLPLFQLATTENLELMTGIEPVTSPLPRECSTN